MLNPLCYLPSSWSFTTGFQTNENPQLALLQACQEGQLGLLQKKMGRPVSADKINTPIDGNLLLHTATKYGHLEIAKWLIENGAKADCKDSHGMTAYDYAVLSANPKEAMSELLSTIIRHKIDWTMQPEVQNKTKQVRSDIQKSIQEIEPRVVSAQINAVHILFKEAKLNKQKIKELATQFLDDNGNSLVHFLAARGDHKRLKALFDLGIDPNLPNKQGQTPLHFAAAKESSCLQFLLEQGSIFDKGDSNGVSPIALMGLNASEKDPLNLTAGEVALAVLYIADLFLGAAGACLECHDNYIQSIVVLGVAFAQVKLFVERMGLKCLPFLLLTTAFPKGSRLFVPAASSFAVCRCAVIGYGALKRLQSVWENREKNPIKLMRNIVIHGLNLSYDITHCLPTTINTFKTIAEQGTIIRKLAANASMF